MNKSDRTNPYLASKQYTPHGAWYDSFAKSGQLAWLVFEGERFLAQVQNEQQAKNVVAAINDIPNW